MKPGRMKRAVALALVLLFLMAGAGVLGWGLYSGASSQKERQKGGQGNGPVADGAGAYPCPHDGAQPSPLGLFGTLPIYWSEAADLADYLEAGRTKHWARVLLEECHTIRPIDFIHHVSKDEEPAAPGNLSGLDHLLIAQPRVLSAAENVALDNWVRAGGRVLLFADPMLTAHSLHPLGDSRRPADVVILSPILARWGLALEFDEDQPPGERIVQADGALLPVDLAGRLVSLGQVAEEGDHCTISAGGLLAQCNIGRGRVVVMADAALLDGEWDPAGESGQILRRQGLVFLLMRAFGA